MSIINKLLPTTVVGSYPVVRTKGLRSLLNPMHGAMETAVSDQIRAGIDIISDGQVAGDMISIIASQMPGIKGQNVTGLVQPAQRGITLQATKYALSKHPAVKGIITGPTTLSHGLKIATPLYKRRDELVLDLAQALAAEAKRLEEAGVTVIQIDEPILSTGAADIELARQAVETITSGLRVPTCLHVCGTLSGVIDEVLKMQVSVFDFEFSNNAENIEVLSEKDLRDRMLGLGVVDSTDPAIESVETIMGRIRQGVDIFGAENLLIDPDCGLRMHTQEIAFEKLSHMAEAAGNIRQEL